MTTYGDAQEEHEADLRHEAERDALNDRIADHEEEQEDLAKRCPSCDGYLEDPPTSLCAANQLHVVEEDEAWDPTTDPIDGSQDILDSRDIIKRIEELQEGKALEALTDEESAELDNLTSFQSEMSGGDWQYGETLIRDSYFEDYARDFADDVIEGFREARWPFTHIDWEAAAGELQQDYTSGDLNGTTYWGRG